MKNLHVFCLAFNSIGMISETMKNFEEQKPDYPVKTKLLVDQHWPLANAKEQSRMLQDLAEQHGWTYVKPIRNRGVGPSYDWVLREIEAGKDDVIYCADPDERIDKPKYLDAIMDVFAHAPECYTVQTNQKLGEYLTYPKDDITIGKTPVLRFHQAIAWANGAFSVAWLNRIGGFLQAHPIYGHCESSISEACKKYGGRFYILRDFYNTHMEAHPVYSQWKHASARFETRSSFADWLKEKGLNQVS